MIQSLKKWITYITGSPKSFHLEHRILNFILLAGSFVFLFASIVTYLAELPINAVDMVAFPTYFCAFILARHVGKFTPAIIIFILANLTMFNFSWIPSNGINGPIIYLFFCFIFSNFTLISFKTSLIINAIFIADALALIYLGGISNHYQSELQRKNDFAVYVLFGTMFSSCVIQYLKNAYQQEKLRSEEFWKQRINIESQMISDSKMAAVGRLAAGIAHNLNNSLEAIRIATENIKEASTRPPINLILFDKNQKVILDNLNKISEISLRLHEFSQKDQAEAELINLDAMIKEALLLTRFHFATLQPHYKIEIAPNANQVIANHSQLLTVFTNILLNCRKAFDACSSITPEITIRTELQIGKILISISHNGQSMTLKEKQQIFDPFCEPNPPQKVGLGLSIIYGIIKLHSGELTIDNGCEFKIYLPYKNS